MDFYNTGATEDSLVHECWDLCDADITSYPLAKVTRRFNLGLEELVAEILNADGGWQYDDTNHTDLPIGTGTLVEAQESYSFSSEYLEIEQISVKDVNGNWNVLDPIDPSEFRNVAIEEYFAATGMPRYYDILGDTIKLYPAPTATAVTLASGLKVRFKRTVDLFTVSDTTQEPGLPSTHHKILAYMAAVPYCMSYKKDRVALYEKKIDEMKKTLIKHYSRRQLDVRKVMTNEPIQFR